MSIEITDAGQSILMTGLKDSDKEVNFNKDDLSLTLDVSSELVAVTDGRASYSIDYNDVTIPAGLTSAEDLRDYINSLNSGGGGGGGDASAANQLTQIGLETTIAANTTALTSVDYSTEATQALNLSELTDINENTSLASSADVTSVASSVSVVTIKAANSNRKSLIVTNDGSDVLYLKYGAGASLTSYTIQLFAEDLAVIDDFSGEVTGIWDVATGSARVTETT